MTESQTFFTLLEYLFGTWHAGTCKVKRPLICILKDLDVLSSYIASFLFLEHIRDFPTLGCSQRLPLLPMTLLPDFNTTNSITSFRS